MTELTEIRTDREEAFALGREIAKMGAGRTEADRTANYAYYLHLPMEDLMDAKTILDAGAGEGLLKKGLKQLGSKAKVTNVDLVRGPGIDIVSPIESMPMIKDGQFDLVVANWAIPSDFYPEHGPDFLAKEIRELYRVTKRSGRIHFLPVNKHTFTTKMTEKDVNAEENFKNVTRLLEELKRRDTWIKFKIIREYENHAVALQNDVEVPDPKHNQDYWDLLIIQK